MDAVFLGLNEAGEDVYDWLTEREDVEVLALLTEKEQLSLIEELEPEIVISSGFRYTVPQEIIDVPEKGVVNLHPSFLPFNRGSHPYIWPLVDGTPAGVSLHYMNEEIDEGPVIDRWRIEKRPEDDSKSLRQRLIRAQVEQFVENWSKVKKGVQGTEQDPEEGTLHRKEDLDRLAELDLEASTEIGDFIDRLRGLSYTDAGVAFFEEDGERYYVKLSVTPESELDLR